MVIDEKNSVKSNKTKTIEISDKDDNEYEYEDIGDDILD